MAISISILQCNAFHSTLILSLYSRHSRVLAMCNFSLSSIKKTSPKIQNSRALGKDGEKKISLLHMLDTRILHNPDSFGWPIFAFSSEHRLLLSQCHTLFCFMAFFSTACETITRFISFYSIFFFSFFFLILGAVWIIENLSSLSYFYPFKMENPLENFIQLDDSFNLK